jgi:hypothetical protein
MIHDNFKKDGFLKITLKKFNQQISNYRLLNDQICTLFQKSLSWSFFVGLIIFSP